MADSILSKLNDRVKQYGLPTLVSRVGKRIFSRFGFRREVYLYCHYDLANTPPEKKLKDGFTMRPLTMDDFLHHTDMQFSESKLNIFRTRFAKEGFFAYGIFHENKLVAYAWNSLFEVEVPLPPLSNDSLKLSPEEGYLFDAYSMPEFRGNGFHPYFSWLRFTELKKMGRKYAVTIIDEDNRSARHNQAKTGFRVVKRLVLEERPGKQFCYSEPSTEAL